MLKRLLQFFQRFFFNPGEGFRESVLECEFDLEGMIKNLSLDQQALEAAKHELPPTQARSPDGTERKIQTLIQKRMAELTHAANQKLIGYNTALLNTDLNNEQQRIRNLAENAKLRLNSRLAEAEQELSSMKSDLERSTAYYRSFQRIHRRETDAEYPESLLYHYSLVVLILLLEALANGYFFARGSEFGMLGGISQSLIVAALNIVPAFLFAGMFCLRYTHHVAVLKRAAACGVLVLYAGWMLVFNLCIAHYREILGSSEETAVGQVIGHLMESPFGLTDLNSWLLLCMGVFFALIATVDGYKADDPYPGYGKIQRIHEEIREHYDIVCQRLAIDAAGIRSDFLDELQILKDNAKSAFTHLCHLAEAKPALIAKHRHGLEVLARAGDALIHHYRSANSRYRKTPAPAYFNESWKPEHTFDLVGTHDERERLDRQKELFEGFPEFLQKTANDLERIHASFFDRLQRIEPAIQPAVLLKEASSA
ncbi:MAG: hypothetical protein L0Y43_01575 [Methylococcaceae bacterium]|nr:hypothetical protein [Methylococcaceae bacterium]